MTQCSCPAGDVGCSRGRRRIDQSILISDAISNPDVKIVGEPFTVDPNGIGVTREYPSAKQFVNA